MNRLSSNGSQQATYYSHDEPNTDTAEKRFANGKLRRAVQHYHGMRSGLTQTRYPNGNIKFKVNHPDGPVLTYQEDGTLNTATKILLTDQAAQTLTERTDSTKRIQNTMAAIRRQLVERHVQDSVR